MRVTYFSSYVKAAKQVWKSQAVCSSCEIRVAFAFIFFFHSVSHANLQRDTFQEIHKHIGREDLNNGPSFILLLLCTISVKPKHKSSFPPGSNGVVSYVCNTFIRRKLQIEDWFLLYLFFRRDFKTFTYLYIYISLYIYKYIYINKYMHTYIHICI